MTHETRYKRVGQYFIHHSAVGLPQRHLNLELSLNISVFLFKIKKMAVCTECGRQFSRHNNMLRHMVLVHSKEDNHEEELSEKEKSDDENESENEADKSIDETEDEDEDETEEDGAEEESEDEAETYNLWTYLKKVAKNDTALTTKFEEIKERLNDAELSEDEVAEQAKRVIRPEILKHISEHYTNFLKLWHYAKGDRYHKQVMKTKRKLMEEEEENFSPAEAIEHAVKKRKYLIVKATDMLEADLSSMLPPPDLTEEEEDDQNENEDNQTVEPQTLKEHNYYNNVLNS